MAIWQVMEHLVEQHFIILHWPSRRPGYLID